MLGNFQHPPGAEARSFIASHWPPKSLLVTDRRQWSGPRSAMETRPARSTAICGSSGSLMTVAAWFEEWPYWPERPHSARDDVV